MSGAAAAAGGTAGRVVVIEDEAAILDVLEYNLRRAGFEVSAARDGGAGLAMVREAVPDVVLLDLMLPTMDGIEVCRALRADDSTRAIPVIMLTAKGDEEDVVHGLEVGADDYVTKPFSTREVVARVQAMMRRSRPAGSAAGDGGEEADSGADDPEFQRVSVAGVVVDPQRHEVLADGTPVRMTRTELRLLHVLLRRPGRVYTREQLVERVMGDNAWVTERTIDVHVRAIRSKLGARADVIETIRGVGYRGRDSEGA